MSPQVFQSIHFHVTRVLQPKHIDSQILHMIRAQLQLAPVDWDQCFLSAGMGLSDGTTGDFVALERKLMM